MESELLEKT